MRKVIAFVFLSLCLLGIPATHYSTPLIQRVYSSGPSGTTDYPWSMFHNNPSRNGVTAASGPTSGSLTWSFRSSGLLYSSPAVVDGKVFISSYDGNVYALDEYSGQQYWVLATSSYISSSPAVSNGIVYITTACPLWTGGPFSCNGGSVYALDENTGAIVWQKAEAHPITSSPLIANGRIFYGLIQLGNGVMLSRDAATGSGIWTIYLSDAIESPPSVDNGRIFVSQADGAVVALNETNGSQIWRAVPFTSPITTFQTSPAVANGILYLGSTSRGVVALNETTGATVWTYGTGGSNSTSVTVNAGRVYFGTGGSRIYALNAATGTLLWSRTTGRAVASTPALALGSASLFVGSNDGYLYALNPANGVLIWRYLTGSGVPSSPSVADGRVFFGSNDLHVYALGPIVPKLYVSISSNSTALRPGQVAALTMTVTNGTVPQPGVNLTFTSSQGGTFSQSLATSPGIYQSNFTAPLTISKASTTIQIIASMMGFLGGANQTSISLNPRLRVSVSSNSTALKPGRVAALIVTVTNGTVPQLGVALIFSSSQGGTFSQSIAIGPGVYRSNFTSPTVSYQVAATIVVNASMTGFFGGTNQTVIILDPLPTLTVAVAARPNSTTPGAEITLMIRVTNATILISGASLQFFSSAGGSFSSVSDLGSGNYTAIFSAPLQSSNPTVTVQASKSGFNPGQAQTTVQVNGFPDLTGLKISGIPIFILLAGGVILFLLLAAMIVQRRKSQYQHTPPQPSFTY